MNVILRILVSLPLSILLAIGFCNCGQESATDMTNKSAAPANPIDRLIDEYEKTAHEYVYVEKKHRKGDVSVTMRVINGDKRARELAAQLRQEATKMTPAQTQRVAEISSRAAPYLLK